MDLNNMDERLKFEERREAYRNYLKWLEEQNPEIDVILHNITSYIGHMQLNRIITIYELYKRVSCIAGHIAEVGVFKGAGSLLFAKLVKIFEPESFTCVHGFDWFAGKSSNPAENAMVSDVDDYTAVCELTHRQSLDGILKIHKVNLLESCEDFFNMSPQLKFKLVLMDIGSYDVMKSAIPVFWKALLPGGIMIFDHYSLNASPGETIALSEILPNAVVHTIPNSWTPNAYVIK